MAVDVGNHAYSLGRYLESKGQPVLMSGYLGSIGFGYPAAMGAWAAAPGRPIVAVTGDGGFGQYALELTTAVKYGIPIKHVLLDNHALGKISKEQLAGQFPVWHTSLREPRLGRATRNSAARPASASTQRGQLDAAMADLFAADGPALLCVAAGRRTPLKRSNHVPSYDDLSALFINCTLKRSPERSHTQGLVDISAHIMRVNGVHGRHRAGDRPRHRDRRVARHARARLGHRRLAGDLRDRCSRPTSSCWPDRSGSATTVRS